MKFSLSKSQKKVIKRFNKFCTDGILNKENDSEANHQEISEGIFEMVYKEGPKLVTDLSKVKKENLETDHNLSENIETDAQEGTSTASINETSEGKKELIVSGSDKKIGEIFICTILSICDTNV